MGYLARFLGNLRKPNEMHASVAKVSFTRPLTDLHAAHAKRE